MFGFVGFSFFQGFDCLGVFLLVHTEIPVHERVAYIVIFFKSTVTQSKISVNEILKEKKSKYFPQHFLFLECCK